MDSTRIGSLVSPGRLALYKGGCRPWSLQGADSCEEVPTKHVYIVRRSSMVGHHIAHKTWKMIVV
ncbi:hypothetical protein AKJ16_DCAP09865 [Drosera capensis]